MKSLLIVFIMMLMTAFAVMTAVVGKWADKIERVLVPAHVSLDTAKYIILKEDSLIIEKMKIKRIYYLIK